MFINMSFKMIITAMALAFVLAGCSAKENHDNTAGDNNNNNPQPTEHNDNIVDDAGDAVKDVTDGAGNMVKDMGEGVENAADSMTGNNNK